MRLLLRLAAGMVVAAMESRSVKRSALLVSLFLSGAVASSAPANEADVLEVKVKCRAQVCDFAVTVKHADEGWQHYADGWEVLGEDGEVLATRVLRHPHMQEQPFTRALAGVKIPLGTTRVTVRAHDKVHEHGGAEVSVEIPLAKPKIEPKVAPNPSD